MLANMPMPMDWQGSIIYFKLVGWADKSVVAQNQVDMDLISHNSTCDICSQTTNYLVNRFKSRCFSLFLACLYIFCKCKSTLLINKFIQTRDVELYLNLMIFLHNT